MKTILPWSDQTTGPPLVEPVSVAEGKRNSDVDDSDRDADFARWIVEGRQQVEHDARVSLMQQTRLRTLDRFPLDLRQRFIRLFRPLISVTSVQYYDTGGVLQTWDASNYIVDGPRHSLHLAPGVSWPSTQSDQPNSVLIEYEAGFGTTPEDVPPAAKAAILLLVKHRYDNPDMVVDKSTKELEFTYTNVVSQLRDGFYP